MKSIIISFLLFASVASLDAHDRQWQSGIWRDASEETRVGAFMPIGASTIPLDQTFQTITIDGLDGLTDVAKFPVGLMGHRLPVVINDPVQFAVEKDWLFVQIRPGKDERCRILSRIRR